MKKITIYVRRGIYAMTLLGRGIFWSMEGHLFVKEGKLFLVLEKVGPPAPLPPVPPLMNVLIRRGVQNVGTK